jgi:predicted amidohydrolase
MIGAVEPVVRIAAVQAAPVVLDLEASVEKACGLLAEAASRGVDLAVFPECFLSIYPTQSWAAAMMSDDDARAAIWQRMWDSAVEVDGEAVSRLVAACDEHGIRCAIGVNEREPGRPGGTLYNTLLLLGPDGLIHRHRKLMPTFQERLFHGFGDGRDLGVVETPLGRIGGLICWENRMPLARYAVYRGGPQIWLAPTADYGEEWIALARTIAVEAGAFVVGVCQYVTAADYPPDFPLSLRSAGPLSDGWSCIVAPGGALLAGPLREGEGMLVAECDLGSIAGDKQWFDVVGHYAREDVLLPLLMRPPD